MKVITNDSLQGLEIFINTPTGVKSIWLIPGDSYIISEKSLSTQLKNLAHRRMIRIADYK